MERISLSEDLKYEGKSQEMRQDSSQSHMHVRMLSRFSRVWPCDHLDHGAPGFFIHGILQARTLEWVVMPFSRGSFPPKDWTHFSLCLLHWQAGSLPLVPPGKPGQHLLISQEKRLRSLPLLFLPLTLGLEVYPTRGSDCTLNPTLFAEITT